LSHPDLPKEAVVQAGLGDALQSRPSFTKHNSNYDSLGKDDELENRDCESESKIGNLTKLKNLRSTNTFALESSQMRLP